MPEFLGLKCRIILLYLNFLFDCRKGRHHLVRSQNLLGPIFVTWLLYPRWSEASLECTTERPLTRLKSNLRWLGITLLSSQFHTSLLSMVDPVLVLLIPLGSFLSSEVFFLGGYTCILLFILKEKPEMILFLMFSAFYFKYLLV